MPPRRQIPKIKLKTISNRDVINKIEKNEKLKKSKLIDIFSHGHQKLHQLYSKNENHTYNQDDEIYIGLFPRIKKYNAICRENIDKYLNKKNENKNFLKQYLGFKKQNKEMCNDEIAFLYGNLLKQYSDKNLEFTKNFLSGKKLFKENGLLVRKKSDLEDYYHKEIKKNGKHSKNAMRDIIYINSIFDSLEQKKIKHNSLEKNPLLMRQLMEKRRKSCVAEMLDNYKKTKAYKRIRREEGMAAANLVRLKQKEIEDDEKYIENISKLIKENDNLIEEEKIYPHRRNNPISLLKSKKNENENNNTIFIINRYTNNDIKNFRSIYNDKYRLPNKSKSISNLYSTLYKENDTTKSTGININETKATFWSRNNRKSIHQKYSIKSVGDYSYYNLENKSNSDYIMINDTTKKENKGKFRKLSFYKNNTNNSTSNINNKNNLDETNTKNSCINNEFDDLSGISNANRTNFYNMSSYTNLSSLNNKRNKNKDKIRNTKASFIEKIQEKNKNVSKFDVKEENLDEKEMRWDIYKKYIGLKYKLEKNNNHKLENFCNTFSTLPKIVNDKINKSFELDEKLKEINQNYVQLLLKQKIKGFAKDDEESMD